MHNRRCSLPDLSITKADRGYNVRVEREVRRVKTIVSDEEIEKAFAGTDFGDRKPRALLGMAVLKTLTGYHSGHTITAIMRELGLIDHRGKTTKKGKDFCLWEFMVSSNA